MIRRNVVGIIHIALAIVSALTLLMAAFLLADLHRYMETRAFASLAAGYLVISATICVLYLFAGLSLWDLHGWGKHLSVGTSICAMLFQAVAIGIAYQHDFAEPTNIVLLGVLVLLVNPAILLTLTIVAE